MKHIEEVRKALDKAFESVTGYRNTDTVREAIAAFSALEADVKELVEALRTASLCLNKLTSDSFYDDAKRMARAALSKFQEAK